MRDLARAWLDFARDDLRMAELASKEGIHNQACFHAQQCAEKALKAVIQLNIKVPKVHSLPELGEVCKEQGFHFEKMGERLNSLDRFYTSTRYPFITGMLPEGTPTAEDAREALRIASEIFRWASSLVEEAK